MAGLETLHVVCAVLWLGNFVVTGFWSIRAWVSREKALRIFAAREILVTDLIFTLAFGSAVTVTGIMLAARENLSVLSTFWTRAALEIIIGSGAVWLLVLLPLEIRLRRLAADVPSRTFDRAFAAWNVAGWAVTLALFSVIYLMVAKPA